MKISCQYKRLQRNYEFNNLIVIHSAQMKRIILFGFQCNLFVRVFKIKTLRNLAFQTFLGRCGNVILYRHTFVQPNRVTNIGADFAAKSSMRLDKKVSRLKYQHFMCFIFAVISIAYIQSAYCEGCLGAILLKEFILGRQIRRD